ncbi:MAG: hypothetical protein ERJ67_10145 [Aphanocapsa feldmannii 277cV]|uniref:Uncharacterized protein n=1 Tax=Aphanocapsa feldmannii 277cV TaxID=2507553 RepID=A0A524RL55_9CHRO|nr:MAG: hypothetical protein ERJ67_10145 [Aphanocapsa feldmannii 277cV]
MLHYVNNFFIEAFRCLSGKVNPQEQLHRRREAASAEGGGDGQGDGSSQGAQEAEAEMAWVSYRPVAVFNAADLEENALAGLSDARKAADLIAPEWWTSDPLMPLMPC